MELELRFKALGEVKEGGTWKFQVGVFETLSADYPKNVAIQFWSEKNIALLEALEVDETYTLYCNAESKEAKGNWYTNISCWKVERADMKPTETQTEQPKKAALPKASNTPTSNRVAQPTTPVDHKEEDDLPY